MPLLAATIATVAGGLASVVGKSAGATTAEGAGVAAREPAATRGLAQQIANVERVPLNFRRTIALLETKEGPTLVAGGATDLSAAQVQLAKQLGLTPAPPLPGVHAELTATTGAAKLNLTPTRGVTTVAICPECASDIAQQMGGQITSDYTFTFLR